MRFNRRADSSVSNAPASSTYFFWIIYHFAFTIASFSMMFATFLFVSKTSIWKLCHKKYKTNRYIPVYKPTIRRSTPAQWTAFQAVKGLHQEVIWKAPRGIDDLDELIASSDASRLGYSMNSVRLLVWASSTGTLHGHSQKEIKTLHCNLLILCNSVQCTCIGTWRLTFRCWLCEYGYHETDLAQREHGPAPRCSHTVRIVN